MYERFCKYLVFLFLLFAAVQTGYAVTCSRTSGVGNPGDCVLSEDVRIIRTGDSVKVEAKTYSWKWSAADDRFSFYDRSGRRMVAGPLQPVVLVKRGRNTTAYSSSGKVSDVSVQGNRLAIDYTAVNGKAALKVSLRFDAKGLWLEPFEYNGNDDEDVVSVYYFSKPDLQFPVPGLEAQWLVQPGLSASAAISPVQVLGSRINMDSWLGKGGTMDYTRILQQWGLPSHFFCGMSIAGRPSQVSSLTKLVSDAFCIGLADLPAGDMRMIINRGKCAPVIDYRSDLWGQMHGRGPWKLGATLYWAVGENYRGAISNYYQGLLKAGVIKEKHNSAAKNEVISRPVFNTWGAQLSMNKYSQLLDGAALDTMYAHLKKANMKATCFVIDDKWEENYGTLEHSKTRLPNFEQFINKLRADGFKIGLWAAFLRCDKPEAIGLEMKNMMYNADGQPITKGAGPFYLMDVSQPEVQKVLRSRIKQFMQRYKPDLVKFDFGYELPALSMSVPANPEWAGERLLKLCLDVVVGALREENPDVAVMYYSLSPLFIDQLDLHSTDDLFLNEEEFAPEANRRLFFSSVLGEIGMPSYGSGGYDWVNMDEIWFDTMPSGSLGSLGSFTGDPRDSRPNDRDMAKFNGLAAIRRQSNLFRVEPLYTTRFGANAARASSWIRYENEVPVVAALRTEHINRGKIDAVYKDQVRSDAMVVVASRDEKSITASRRIGVVPFADGELQLKHEGFVRQIQVIAHCFDGSTQIVSVDPPKNGFVRIPLKERLKNNALVEWLEINFDK